MLHVRERISLVHSARIQASYIQPSFLEKLETFREGLTHSLRNRVLLQPSGDEWTNWNVFLRFAHRFADAKLISRNLPKVVEKATVSAPTATPKTVSAVKGPAKSQANKRALPSANQPPEKKKNQPRFDLIQRICRDEKRCPNCFEPAHGPTKCDRADAEVKIHNFANRLKQYKVKSGQSSAQPSV